MIEAAAHVPARIAVLQPPGEDLIQGRSRNHSQMAESGDGLRQPPIGNARSHAALDDRGMSAHDSFNYFMAR